MEKRKEEEWEEEEEKKGLVCNSLYKRSLPPSTSSYCELPTSSSSSSHPFRLFSSFLFSCERSLLLPLPPILCSSPPFAQVLHVTPACKGRERVSLRGGCTVGAGGLKTVGE